MNHIGRLEEGVEEAAAGHLPRLKLLLIVGRLEGHCRLLLIMSITIVVVVIVVIVVVVTVATMTTTTTVWHRQRGLSLGVVRHTSGEAAVVGVVCGRKKVSIKMLKKHKHRLIKPKCRGWRTMPP